MSVRVVDRAPSRLRASVWALLLLCAAAAWGITIATARSMGAGTGTMGLAPAPFLALWAVMMVAMMFPSVAPVAMLWMGTMARDGITVRVGRTASFLIGYILAWTAFGVVAFAALVEAGRLARTAPHASIWVGASIYAAVGLFQLTPLKQACLGRCRTPIGFVLRFSEYRGASRDLRAGLHHGAGCVTCCWALMAAIVALGAMNLLAMAGLATVVLLEKVWRRGAWVARAVGVGFLVLAVLTPFHPWLAPGLHAGSGGAGISSMAGM